MQGCGVALCGQHLFPNDRGSVDRRNKFCGACIKATPRCTSCGVNGIDKYFNSNQEVGGSNFHKWRQITLWPCGSGCHNLLCIRCGTTQDGCAIHKRVHCTAAWYPHWGVRRFPGTLGYQALECCLTPDQQARLQAATDEANAINVAAAMPTPPMALSFQPYMVPSPVLQADGTTLYAGETTAVVQEPLIDLQAPADGHHSPVGFGGSQCSTTASEPPYQQACYCRLTGEPLQQYKCPSAGRVWLCHEDQEDFVCWITDHADYVHPAIGITQVAADSLTAEEIARRTAADADLHRTKAHEAEMLATALALSAADKAEADQLDKQYAAAAAAKKAQEVRGKYEIAKAQANADATHRAFRSAIASGHVSGTPNAEALPTTVQLPITADGTAFTAQHTAAPPPAVVTATGATLPNALAGTLGTTPLRSATPLSHARPPHGTATTAPAAAAATAIVVATQQPGSAPITPTITTEVP